MPSFPSETNPCIRICLAVQGASGISEVLYCAGVVTVDKQVIRIMQVTDDKVMVRKSWSASARDEDLISEIAGG